MNALKDHALKLAYKELKRMVSDRATLPIAIKAIEAALEHGELCFCSDCLPAPSACQEAGGCAACRSQ